MITDYRATKIEIRTRVFQNSIILPSGTYVPDEMQSVRFGENFPTKVSSKDKDNVLISLKIKRVSDYVYRSMVMIYNEPSTSFTFSMELIDMKNPLLPDLDEDKQFPYKREINMI